MADVAPRCLSRGEDEGVYGTLKGEEKGGCAGEVKKGARGNVVPVERQVLGKRHQPTDEVDDGIDEE